MTSTVPAERELRRVIGDGDAVPDGEVEGIGEQELLALYRSMVLLRTYDERSVVYHRQGRIGTYAIFWGHEAIQAGAFHTLEEDDWIFPSYRESAIGLLRECRRRPSSRGGAAIRPAGGTRPTTTSHRSASRSRPTCRTPAGLAWGYDAAEAVARRDRLALRARPSSATAPPPEGAFHEGSEPRRRHARPARPPLQQQPVGDLDAALRPDARRRARRTRPSATGSPGRAIDGARRARRPTHPTARDAVARARAGEGPTLRRGRHATRRRPARDRRRPEGVHRPRAGRGGARERVSSAATSGYLRRARGCSATSSTEEIKTEAAELMRAGIAAAEAEPPADVGLVFEHALADPPASFEHDLAELRRIMDA